MWHHNLSVTMTAMMILMVRPRPIIATTVRLNYHTMERNPIPEKMNGYAPSAIYTSIQIMNLSELIGLITYSLVRKD